LQSYELDVTNEAKWIVALVHEIEDDKITMGHAMDVFRGMKHSKIISMGHDKSANYAKGKNWKKQDTERLFKMLIIRQILKERCELNGMGFANSYLYVGPRSSTVHTQQIKLTLTKEKDVDSVNVEKKKNPRKRPSDAGNIPQEVSSQCLTELMELREQAAFDQHVQPAAIFNDETLAAMSESLPTTIIEFMMIPGVNDQNFTRYGSLFLDITKRFASSSKSKRVVKKPKSNERKESDFFKKPKETKVNASSGGSSRLIRSMSLKM
jgi:superfamily II DNA helicase RecQ